jgi:hypothetical protein
MRFFGRISLEEEKTQYINLYGFLLEEFFRRIFFKRILIEKKMRYINLYGFLLEEFFRRIRPYTNLYRFLLEDFLLEKFTTPLIAGLPLWANRGWVGAYFRGRRPRWGGYGKVPALVAAAAFCVWWCAFFCASSWIACATFWIA